MPEVTSLHSSRYRTALAIWLILVLLFCFSLFKNISYPLFWNDEGDTVVLSARTLKYGYARVDDGRNELYLTQTDRNLGIHAPTGALLYGGSWLKFYVGAVGVWLAQKTDDLYLKTGILRTEFALFGLLGLAILAWALFTLYRGKPQQRYHFWLLFTFFELLSLPLILHLREVRHYSLLILLTSAILAVYIHGRITCRLSPIATGAWMVVLLWLLFNTFYPTYVIFLLAIIMFECLRALQMWRAGRQGFWRSLRSPAVWVCLSLATVIPLLWAFRTLEISEAISREQRFGWPVYVANLKFIFTYFTQFEFFYLAVVSHFIASRLRRKERETLDPEGFQSAVVNLMIIFFVVHVVLIARSPFMFQRYLIALQPILAGILALDIVSVWQHWSRPQSAIRTRRWSTALQVTFLCVIFLFSTARMAGPLQGHVTSLFHQYMGPLDFVIPFIKSAFPNPSKLVIAINYEEPCFMYYLESRVILGHFLPNLPRDYEEIPDIMIHRKWWLHPWAVFEPYLRKSGYYRVVFPVLDYGVNNIPDLQFNIHHQFETLRPESERSALSILIRDVHTLPGVWPPTINTTHLKEGNPR
ncbi:MAG: hypothetical protein PHS17_18265 [Desulfobacterales bacterium]|nr:hypothetical protein [Desulfobacterales bacterium]